MDSAIVKVDSQPLKDFALKDLMTDMKQHYSGNTIHVNKKKDGFSTFDDGLLFTFPLAKYEHLSYYCRTSTPQMDTCNVKLFKRSDDKVTFKTAEEKEWKPPIL